jgi:class 3 adenylate cyclase
MDDIRAVMDAVGWERATLVAGAEGGAPCLLFAATFPERSTALVLDASYARRMWAPDYPWGITQERHERILASYDSRWGREPMGIDSMAASLASDPRFREYYVRAMRYGGTPGASRAWYQMTTEIDVRHILPAVRVPTLILHRIGDRAVPVEASRYLAAHIPEARYVELPGADHWWWSGDYEGIIEEVQEFLTGDRPIPEHDRVLATVLFTDIVASTEQAAKLGDRRWKSLLASHNDLVRRHLQRFQGQEIDTVGDGFLATFDGPARAIRCAQAIVRDVPALGVEIRAGLHTGEIERLGTDIGGIAVHLGARVMALAGPSEVLVSSTVKDLVVGSGIAFEDRGRHPLKGVPGDWQLFAVRADSQ